VIGPYSQHPARFLPYDPVAAEVASLISTEIHGVEPSLTVEHVGSSAVPGCAGKGVVDLAVCYSPGGLDAAKAALDRIGFQPQPGPDPFPESRPMRVGSAIVRGGVYQLHAHVIEQRSAEIVELLAFREALRADATMRRDYEARKQAIISDGVNDTAAYAEAKGGFVHSVLREVYGD
jgi:GrpB-like predicted nucleotidyltransferase (UPF0157 family)